MTTTRKLQIQINDKNLSSDILLKIATQKNRQTLIDLLNRNEELDTKEIKVLCSEIRALIVETMADTAEGTLCDGYQLGSDPEEFFTTANRKPRNDSKGNPVEKISQAAAIRSYLGKPANGPVTLTECELVNSAIRAAQELKARGSNYGGDDLIREGISMIGQSLISKRVAEINAAGETPDNLPGSADSGYLTILEELRVLRSDPDKWFSNDRKINPFGRRRGNKITVNILARACNTNDNQIRTFLKRHGISDVFDPKAAKQSPED